MHNYNTCIEMIILLEQNWYLDFLKLAGKEVNLFGFDKKENYCMNR